MVLNQTPSPYLSTGFPQVVVVSGTNYEMGVQYGRQTAPAILHNMVIFKSKLYGAHGSENVTKDMQVWDYYLMQCDPTLRDWVQGISDGCSQKGYSVSYLDLILLMVYPTELWSRPKAPYPKMTGVQTQNTSAITKFESLGKYHSCNTFAANGTATPDGKPIHGITSMVSTEAMDNIILIAFPKEGASFVSQTYAGRVNGNSALNSDGFAWTMTAILSENPSWGLTEVYFHYLAQLSTSPADAETYLETTPRGGVTGGFIMTDKSGNISVFECNAGHFSKRKPGDAGEPGPWVVQTNHLVDPSLHEYNPPWLGVIGTYTRYDTVFQYLKEAPLKSIDFSFAKKLFASDDWFEASTGKWHHNEPGGKGISNSRTSVAQSIFFPADLTAYLQTGTPSGNGLPAHATGEYVKIKLAMDPKKVVDQADADALAFYWDATGSFEHDLNAKAPYLTPPVVEDVREKLDQSFTAYSLGMDRAAFANLEEDTQKKLDLWASALTYYAKAQLYAEMAKTALVKASTGTS